MAIAQAMCTSFKKELLEGVHNFKLSGGDTFKLALYAEGSGGKSSTTATLGATTTAFTTTGEVASRFICNWWWFFNKNRSNYIKHNCVYRLC